MNPSNPSKKLDPLKKARRSLAVLNGDDNQIRKQTGKAVKDALNAFDGERLQSLSADLRSVLDTHINTNNNPITADTQ